MTYLARNYNRKKISFKYGKGSYLYSKDNTNYLSKKDLKKIIDNFKKK